MSIRTTLKLNREKYAELKKLSVLKKKDVTELIEEAITLYLKKEGVQV